MECLINKERKIYKFVEKIINMSQFEIRVGIKTEGSPVITKRKATTIVENMLIGDGFHWQKTIRAELPGKLQKYEGREDEHSDPIRDSNNISLINVLPLETYLECVVGSEMNPSAPIEFLKAHAVISRSWALGKILGIHPHGLNIEKDEEEILIGWEDTGTHIGFHVCSDDHCQRYQGLQPISLEAMKAIRETKGEVLITNDGKILDARFSKCCGGLTEIFETCWQNKKMPGIENVVDPWCKLSGMSMTSKRVLLSSVLKDYDLETDGYGYSWEVLVSKEQIRRRLKECFGRNIGKILKLMPLHRGPSGRIDLLRVEGKEGFIDIGKELWIRRILSESHLYSSAFEVQDKGDSFMLRGKGWGHGVGLCQIGAANMAFHDYTYLDILSFYYPGTRVRRFGNF